MRLAVELYKAVVGTLDGDAHSFDFVPSAEGIDRFGTNSPVLSVTMPLVWSQRRGHASRRRNWFGELLPEGDQYDYLLARGGLRHGDTPAFLARYGRDLAGALQIWDLDDPTEPKTPAIRNVTPAEVRALLEDPIGSPLANDPQSGKSSLGGVQPKAVLAKTSDGWAQVLGGYPSTHILKPQLPGALATVIFDEEYGSRIARRLGLAGFATWIEEFDGLPAIVIERYDRAVGGRVHQEDFSQVLGASRNQKYQEVGGVVSLRRIAAVLKTHAPEPDLRRLARLVVLAVGIGNLDLHTKNLGLLHPAGGGVTLAPAYDVVPQAHLPGDGRMALAVNGKYRHADITRADLETEFAAWGLRRAEATVDETLVELAVVVEQERPLDGAFPLLDEQLLALVTTLKGSRRS
jgi:serine/threonine-protein kinase HipA